MKILMVLTSHDKLGDTGKKTGFWLEEFAAPYYVFKDAGADVTLASPEGGQPPLDPNSNSDDAQTDATKRFKDDDAAQRDLANTKKLAEVDAEGFDAIFYPGGHGPLWDLAENKDSKRLIETFFTLSQTVGPLGAGVLADRTGNLGDSLIAASLLLLAGAGCAFAQRPINTTT